jgi:hypothetical protein
MSIKAVAVASDTRMVDTSPNRRSVLSGGRKRRRFAPHRGTGRGIADYFRAIANRPGFQMRLASCICFATAGLMRRDSKGVFALVAGLLIVFPLGYVWWRWWGPR